MTTSSLPSTTAMSKQTFFLVSLPTSISQSNDRDEALTALRSTVSNEYGTTTPFAIPAFKIGTLDALVQQADDLSKLESGCEQVVGKVADSLRGILEGDEEKIADQKNVNDREWPVWGVVDDQWLSSTAQDRWRTTCSRSSGTRSSIAPTSPSRSWSIYFKRLAPTYRVLVRHLTDHLPGNCQCRQRHQGQIQPIQQHKDLARHHSTLTNRQPIPKIPHQHRQPLISPRPRRLGVLATTPNRRSQHTSA